MGSHPTYDRNREMAIAYLQEKITLAELGRRYGISGGRVRMIIQRQFRRMEHCIFYAVHHEVEGQIQAPEPEAVDFGEGVDWTPELQLKEFELIGKYR